MLLEVLHRLLPDLLGARLLLGWESLTLLLQIDYSLLVHLTTNKVMGGPLGCGLCKYGESSRTACMWLR